MINISVAMAVYNGEKYLNAQMDSILKQLDTEDEVIVSLDPSTDKSEAILKDYCSKDQRIKLLKGPGKGVIKNFENALRFCSKELIFLSDQDDEWLPDKVAVLRKYFTTHKDVAVVLHDARIVDENRNVIGKSFFEKRGCKLGILKNIVKNSYIGCCMAFRKDVLEHALPFPEKLPMHDQWIGIVGECIGRNVLLKRPLIYYRRHGNNASSESHAGFLQMLQWRLEILRAVWRLRKKVRKNH